MRENKIKFRLPRMTDRSTILNVKHGFSKTPEGISADLSHRILVVEDETKLQEHLAQIMREEGFSVFSCTSYRELEGLLKIPARFDVIVLDRLLHGRDSAQLVVQLKLFFAAKIMILSAVTTASEKAALLDLGADDYLAKPFDSDELVARIRVLLRRRNPELILGNLALNLDDRSMRVSGNEIRLTNKEFLLLRTLLQTPRKIFNKLFLYKRVWEMSEDVESNVVEATVNKLRRRLKDADASVQIKNGRNTGYWIEE